MKEIKKFEQFVISQKGLLIRNDKCLIMEMRQHSGFWDLPGGRIDKGEDGKKAFLREIKEETGLNNFLNLGIIDYNTWFTADKTPVCGIINLIQNEKDKIILSKEHLRIEWVEKENINKYNFFWKMVPDSIQKGFQILKIK